MIRMLGSDLDGTLVRSDDTVSPRVRAALSRATAEGLLVAFVTGRPPRWLHDIADQVGHTGVAVAANGAVLYDLATGDVVAEHLLDPALMLELALELRGRFPQIAFAVEYGGNPERCAPPFGTFGSEPAYIHEWVINPPLDRAGLPIPPPLIADLATIVSRPGVKLLAKDRAAEPDALLAAAAALIDGRASVTHSSSIGLLEIGAGGVTKASGLAQLAATHGIAPHEVATVGDMPNDLPMLAWSGQSYAVANAHPSVLAAAQYRLPSNDDDAVAVLIDSLLGARAA